jgi:hypothetical protein
LPQAKTGAGLKSLRYTNFVEFVDLDFVLTACPNLDTVGISAGGSSTLFLVPGIKSFLRNICPM